MAETPRTRRFDETVSELARKRRLDGIMGADAAEGGGGGLLATVVQRLLSATSGISQDPVTGWALGPARGIEVVNSLGAFDSGADDRLTAPTDGVYLVNLSVPWPYTGSSLRYFQWIVPEKGTGGTQHPYAGDASHANAAPTPPSTSGVTTTGIFTLPAGGYVSAFIRFDGGGSLNPGTAMVFSMIRLGALG